MKTAELIDLAIEGWQEAASPDNVDGDSSVWLSSDLEDGAPAGILTNSLPRLPVSSFTNWLGRRLLWWPAGVTDRHRISIASSRLGQRKDLKQWWFDALRTAAIRCDMKNECLVVVDSTAAASAVVRASELFGIPRLRVIVSEEKCSDAACTHDWLTKVQAEHHAEATSDIESVVYLAPEFVSNDEVATNTNGPLVDRMLLCGAERIVLLSARASGHVADLTKRHLHDTARNVAPVLGLKQDTAEVSIGEDIFTAGAVPWILQETPPTPHSSGQTVSFSKTPPDDSPLTLPENWLCHWTRARSGPWPGQEEDEYLDSLILGCDTASRSAYATLLRILECGCVEPSALSRNTVSFTAVPLADFRKHRVYRRHRRHYDFEPWGIAIRRPVLEQLGARAVEYRTAVEISERESKWFEQPSTDAGGRIDWTTEQEWRIPDRIRFSELSNKDVVVFTDTLQKANTLQQHSQYSVLTVPEC